MSLSNGQQLALQQLHEIERFADGALEILRINQPAELGKRMEVVISVRCADMAKASGGLPLAQRERIIAVIPADFPFLPPGFWSTHARLAGFPHVQWSRYLCVYQSPEVEWVPGDGMYGAIGRLEEWLRQGAIGQFDPVGGPIHPPAVYTSSDHCVVPEVDTPTVADHPWLGLASLERRSAKRVHIVGWTPLCDKPPSDEVSPTVLLHAPLPFEYPGTVQELITALAPHGIRQKTLFSLLKLAALAAQNERQPLYFVLGAPMRGIAGDAQAEQHLAIWHLDDLAAQEFRLTVTEFPEINEQAEAILAEWAGAAKVRWCSVYEQRPATTVRRDHDAPLSWFSGKSVALWGCGAIGSQVGEFLARAGVTRLSLYDRSTVSPGLLARQLFDDEDVGRYKVDALASRLKRINPVLEITTSTNDLLQVLEEDRSPDVDVVVNATASRTVALKLECVRSLDGPPVLSLAVGHRAERGVVTLVQPHYTGGPFDADRRSKIELCNRDRHLAFRDEFWPDIGTRRIFQPEPGCSNPTFIGSAADIGALTGSMLNIAARRLQTLHVEQACADFVELPHLSGDRPPARAAFTWESDLVVHDPNHDYQIRIEQSALREMRAWISQGVRRRGARIETGGLIFGEFNEPARIVWISEVSGPPPDSIASAEHFLCGTAGTAEDGAERKTRTKGAASFVGMWHTHPVSRAIPSHTDLAAMYQLVVESQCSPRHTLMLIVGRVDDDPEIGAYVFTRHDFEVIEDASRAGMREDENER